MSLRPCPLPGKYLELILGFFFFKISALNFFYKKKKKKKKIQRRNRPEIYNLTCASNPKINNPQRGVKR